MSNQEFTESDIRDMSKKEVRKEFPSGWMEISRYETLVLAIDALLESPAAREFTIDDLADLSGATSKSLQKHIDVLVNLDIVEETDGNNNEPLYSLNGDSPIVQDLYELNSTVERVKNGNGPETIPSIVTIDEDNLNEANTDSANLSSNLHGPMMPSD
jgi:hypothetical protein